MAVNIKTVSQSLRKQLHSRDMKTQHIKFEILKERLSLFDCNLIQHDFVLNMFSIGQICK